jgi:uncharacterized protein YjbI with pentapeptide repeats
MKKNLNKSRMRTSLKRQLENHELWLKSNGKQGKIFSAVDEDLQELDLSKAILIKADFSGSDLSKANLSESNLSETKLIGTNLSGSDFYEAIFIGANLIKADLHNADLFGAKLLGANLSEANLSGSDLSDADLRGVQALGTNFSSANFTNACIQDWNINCETKLDNVNCKAIYLKYDDIEHKYTDRRPSDENAFFALGDFAQLVRKIISTVDLIFRNGIDWRALSISLDRFKVESDGGELKIQAIEDKEDGDFVIKVKVPPDANKQAIEQFLKYEYEIASKALESQYRSKLEAKDQIIDSFRQQNTNLLEMMKFMAARPINLIQTQTQGQNFMSDTFNIDQSKANNPNVNLAKDNAKLQVNQTNSVLEKEKNQDLSQTTKEIQEIFENLSQRYPNASDQKKQTVAELEFTQKAEIDPTFKDRILSAAKSGSLELVKVITNNPFVSVPMETVKGWFDA